MEPSFTKYIWKHTRRQQIWMLCIVAISMIPYYMAFDLPKMIVNGPIQGVGFEAPGDTQVFMPIDIPLPFVGSVNVFGGMDLDRLQTLIGLCFAFLALVIVNGLFKYYLNTYKGLMGERLLRRVRFDLVDRILRFRPHHFKHIKGGEVSSMVKDEVEPLGGFTADAFVQPAILGGQALTALVFIFVQHFWLGLVALAVASLQIGIIPRLRQRLIVLGRERQLGARQLAGRVNEIVEGINTIHAYDTTNYERAEIADRLGALFKIRYEIYQRKFMVKFLNNLLAQMSPFLFYLIGGVLTITGKLDVGQLIAVINAYKEFPGPLKELIDWDLARQDVQVKYEQVIEQFDVENMIDPELHVLHPANGDHLESPLRAMNLTVQDDSGARALEQVSLDIAPGETVAIVGDANSGANVIAETMARIAYPAAGRICSGDKDIFSLPEAITGRRISYASADAYFFAGSLKDNLLYGLKNAPQGVAEYSDEASQKRKWDIIEAKRSGNPDYDIKSNWIDHSVVAASSRDGDILTAIDSVIEIVDMTRDVFGFASQSVIDPEKDPDFANDIVKLRKEFHAELEARGRSNLIVPFEIGTYNSEAKVIDNLVFGVLKQRSAEGLAYFRNMLIQSGLSEQLYYMGRTIMDHTLEMFQHIPKTHPFYERLDYMEPHEVPHYQAMILRTGGIDYQNVSDDDRVAFIFIAFEYIEPKYRFGVLNDQLKKDIVNVRGMIARNTPAHLQKKVERYNQDRFLSAASLIDNVIFGKVNHRYNDAEIQVQAIMQELVQSKPALMQRIFALGLEYDLGPSGRRLTAVQRQKLNLARALIRRSDYYVFNRPLSGLDPTLQETIIRNALDFIATNGDKSAVIWVLATSELSKHFNRCVEFEDKAIRRDAKNLALDDKVDIL